MVNLKGALSGLSLFWLFQNDKECLTKDLTSKALFVLKIFKPLSWLYGHVANWLD